MCHFPLPNKKPLDSNKVKYHILWYEIQENKLNRNKWQTKNNCFPYISMHGRLLVCFQDKWYPSETNFLTLVGFAVKLEMLRIFRPDSPNFHTPTPKSLCFQLNICWSQIMWRLHILYYFTNMIFRWENTTNRIDFW